MSESEAARRLAEELIRRVEYEHDGTGPTLKLSLPNLRAAILAYGSAREREGLERAAKLLESRGANPWASAIRALLEPAHDEER